MLVIMATFVPFDLPSLGSVNSCNNSWAIVYECLIWLGPDLLFNNYYEAKVSIGSLLFEQLLGLIGSTLYPCAKKRRE